MNERSPAPQPSRRVLLVDDDPADAAALAAAMLVSGHAVRLVSSGAAARAAVAAERPDLAVLELLLPDVDGLLLCSDMKAAGVPVLICSATRRRRDRVLGLRLGADDFVAKPYDVDELLARVGVLLRSGRPADAGAVGSPSRRRDEVGEAGRPATRADGARPGPIQSIDRALSPAEARLLAALSAARVGALPRGALTRAALGRPDDGSTLALLVSRLRTKLARLGPSAPRIATVQGVGYALVDGVAVPAADPGHDRPSR